jgi:hypothetical protein
MQRLLANIGDVSGVFLPSLRQALKPAGVIVRGGQGFQELLHVAEPTPARGRFEAGIEVDRVCRVARVGTGPLSAKDFLPPDTSPILPYLEKAFRHETR